MKPRFRRYDEYQPKEYREAVDSDLLTELQIAKDMLGNLWKKDTLSYKEHQILAEIAKISQTQLERTTKNYSRKKKETT